MTEHGWDRDDWPAIFEQVMAADILVLCTPIWLGEKSSVCTQVIERLYGNSHLLNEHGQYAYYGRVGGCLVTGNEDGVKHCAMNVLYSLQHLGYVIPPQADAGWIGEAGPGAVVPRPGLGRSRERLHEPQHDVHDVEPAAPRAHAEGRRRHPGARQPALRVGRRLPLRLPEPRATADAMATSVPSGITTWCQTDGVRQTSTGSSEAASSHRRRRRSRHAPRCRRPARRPTGCGWRRGTSTRCGPGCRPSNAS